MPKFTQGELLVKICYSFGGVGLFALSLTASALSLGQSQGQVVLGAPLDLVFQWQPDADMDAASSCVGADVLLGERRIDASRVNITPMARRAGLPASVRVRASVVIDEPVVVVKLSAGCQGPTSRSYTFFAELPETVAASGAALDIRQLSELPAPAIAPPPERLRAPAPARRAEPASRPTASVNPARTPAEPRPRKPEPKPASKPAKAPAVPAPTVTAPGESGLRMEPRLRIDSRLRMEPLDAWAAPAAGAAALTPPGATAAPGADGLPDVTLPAVAPEADQRVLALETQIQSMKAREAGQNASLARISSQLEALQAEKEQGSPWTLPLLAALAIALAVLAWLLLRLRNLTQAAANSWRDSGDGNVAAMPAAAGDTAFGSAEPFVAPAATASTPPGAAFDARQDEVTTEFGLSAFGAAVSADAAALPAQKPRAVVKPEELFDVRQQAEFFTSVGEYDQAIAVMRKHIAEHEDSSPLAYLELLGLFYQLSRKTEYEELRRQFEQHFATRVPEMAQFAQRGRSLAHYPELLANIEALWPTEEVGDLLESHLFRQPGQDLLFDLEAFDDLLLLQAVARTTPARARGETAGRVRTTPAVAADDTPPASVAATALAAAAAGAAPGEQPWATLDRSHASAPPLVPLPEALATPELSLDIPSSFDVPEGPFARAEPLGADAAAADAPAASSLLDIDLSDVGRWQPLDLPAVEPLPFDLDEFPKRPIVGSLVDQNVGFNAIDPKQPLPADLELTPWEEESSPDSIFSAWNAARTDRVIAKPVVDEDRKDKSEAGNGPG